MTRIGLRIEGKVDLEKKDFNLTCVATSAEDFIPRLEWAINYRPVSCGVRNTDRVLFRDLFPHSFFSQYDSFKYRDLAEPKIVEKGPRHVYIENRLSLHGKYKAHYVKKVQCRAFYRDGYFQSLDADISYEGNPVVYDKSLKLVEGPAGLPPREEEE